MIPLPYNLAEECKAYHKKIEQSIDNLHRINAELEHEKRLLQDEINQLRTEQKPSLTFAQQYLIDLCGRMAEAWRYKFDVLQPGIQEIIRAWDKVEGGQADGNKTEANSEINT